MQQQLALVVGLQRALRRRQRRALRVVDQVQHQAAAGLTVAQRIELAQPGDAAVEHAVATLAVDIGGRVTGQRGGHFHALGGQEIGQVRLPGLGQDGEVASVDDLDAQRTGTTHQVAEMRVQLRRATGQVQRGDATCRQHRQHQCHMVRIHHLGAVGPGGDMTVQATLVALVAQVDVERVEPATTDRREIGGGQQGQRGVHGGWHPAGRQGPTPLRRARACFGYTGSMPCTPCGQKRRSPGCQQRRPGLQ